MQYVNLLCTHKVCIFFHLLYSFEFVTLNLFHFLNTDWRDMQFTKNRRIMYIHLFIEHSENATSLYKGYFEHKNNCNSHFKQNLQLCFCFKRCLGHKNQSVKVMLGNRTPRQEALNTWRGRLQHFLQILYNQKIQKVILIWFVHLLKSNKFPELHGCGSKNAPATPSWSLK